MCDKPDIVVSDDTDLTVGCTKSSESSVLLVFFSDMVAVNCFLGRLMELQRTAAAGLGKTKEASFASICMLPHVEAS